MSMEDKFSDLKLGEEGSQNYQYINVFKNPNKLPINEIHIERTWREIKKTLPKNFEFVNKSPEELEKAYFEKKTEVIPALDKRWLPKVTLPTFEPLSFCQQEEESLTFLTKNTLYLEALDYLLKCDFHQFWCTIFFEPSAAVSLRSFLLNPIFSFRLQYLEGEYLEVYQAVFSKFLLVYEKLLTFRENEVEYMPEPFVLKKLTDNKLINLPIVITLAILYKDCDKNFINRVINLYFSETSDIEFLTKEVESQIEQNMICLEMVGGHVCGFDESANIVPISIEKRPAVFSLQWVYSVVSYLLNILVTSNMLFQVYNPAVEIALNKKFPFRLPFIYVSVYRELYELLDEREETQIHHELFKKVIKEINLGRSEFVDVFHIFVCHFLDDAFKYVGDSAKQEAVVENYLNLLTTALEDEYFICDYNVVHNVAAQNEMFESCCEIDSTRTEFIISCINKLSRQKKLEDLSKVNRYTLESVFRDFTPITQVESTEVFQQSQPGPSGTTKEVDSSEIDEKIKNIMDMFPHLGDGFIYQCLEAYNFNTSDVINAILENNLPPHLSEIPFDSIRIPPEPEPEKPILAYKGKKPDYDDALQLLNDKAEKKEIKNLVLEGIQYNYGDDMYDDEYDDRFEDDITVPIADNPATEDLQIFNPNRRNKNRQSDSEEDEESEGEAAGTSTDRNRLNFCEDPAVLRERREAKFKTRHPNHSSGSQAKPKGDVVGKPKGQGQDKSTLLSRQKKNVNKSSRANHNRKGGAQFKRNRGMIPS